MRAPLEMRLHLRARGNAPCHEAAADISAFQSSRSSYAARPSSVTGRCVGLDARTPLARERRQGRFVAQSLSESYIAPVRAHLDGAHTGTHHLRHLREFEPVEPMQLDHLALVGG